MFDADRSRDLKTLLQTTAAIETSMGFSGARVFQFRELGAFLKVANHGGQSDLQREKGAFDWLEGKLLVPTVLGFQTDDEAEYLLTSELTGVPASDLVSSRDASHEVASDFLRQAARATRIMHDVPIEDCPLDQRLDAKFELARRNILNHLLSETDAEFASEHDGKSPDDVYHELMAERPIENDLVFTHGDLCLPNIIVNDGAISGFIDMGLAGVADRYTDIAIFFRSFRLNCKVDIDLENIFREEYGLDELDRTKLDFYTRLDDLF